MMQSPAPEGQMAGLPDPGLLPIVVDLDGTLLQTDTLPESLLLLGRQSRAGLWQALQQLGQGKAAWDSTNGYVYDPKDGDPDNGVKPGTAFADLPEDWVCPVCGAAKDEFSKE